MSGSVGPAPAPPCRIAGPDERAWRPGQTSGVTGPPSAGRRAPRSVLLVLLLAAATLAGLAGCGGGGDGGDGCGPDVRERLDPSSGVHLLPGAPEPDYLSDPPTSGPHRAGPLPAGVLATPLERPVQVQVLEAGKILLQHEGLSEAERLRLEALASADVVVAPGRDLPAPVVATAWGRKRTCGAVEQQPLADFVHDHRGRGPAHG
jgi:hypothetical protein